MEGLRSMEEKIYLRLPPGDTKQSYIPVDPDTARWAELEEKYGWKYEKDNKNS